MTSLTRWDPFREITTLRNAMDRLFEEAFVLPSRLLEPFGRVAPALDVVEEEDRFIVTAAIPGVRPEDLDVSVADNVLTIKGEVRPDEGIKDEQYYIRERRFGSFTRSVSLPAPVEADQVEATYENGVLRLTLPKAEEVRPKKISIKTPKVIEGKKK